MTVHVSCETPRPWSLLTKHRLPLPATCGVARGARREASPFDRQVRERRLSTWAVPWGRACAGMIHR